MRTALFLHMLSASVWLGCVLVEALFEHAIDRSPAMRRFISELHWKTDVYIEIPAFTAAGLTAAYMMSLIAMTPLMWAKAIAGLIAILFNVVCVRLVWQRLKFARGGDFVAWEAVDRRQHRYGAVVLLGLVIAGLAGGHLFAAL